MSDVIPISRINRTSPWSAKIVPNGATGGRLRILATTDLHGQILSYDYFSNRTLFGSGLAQLASLIEAARAEVPASILLDNGDFLQGSALTELAAQPHRRRRKHPAVQAFHCLGYDAVALGNHEFNYGLDLLERAVATARFPMLSANLLRSKADDPREDCFFTKPFAIFERMIDLPDGRSEILKIGVIGLTPPEVAAWDRRHVAGRVVLRGMVEAAKIWVPELRRQGADVVVCLAHTGITEAENLDVPEARAREIAAIDGIDVVITGHNHLVFPDGQPPIDPVLDTQLGRINGKPVVQPGHSGSHLGLIDLWLDHSADTGWRVTGSRTAAIDGPNAVAGLPAQQIRTAEEPLRELLRKDHRAALSWMREPIGSCSAPITSYFSLVTDCWITRLTAEASLAHLRRSPKMLAFENLPMIGLVNAFRTGGRGGPLNYTDIRSGQITLRSLFDLNPFPNAIVAERTTAAALIARLERGTATLNQLLPQAKDQHLINPSIPGFIFEIAVGVSYSIDLSKPPLRRDSKISNGRIASLSYLGRNLLPREPIIVVSNSYLASLYPELPKDIIFDDGTTTSSAIADYLRENGNLRPQSGPRWSLSAPAGSSAMFETGIGATQHMAEAAGLRPEMLGMTAEGFQRFRLHF